MNRVIIRLAIGLPLLAACGPAAAPVPPGGPPFEGTVGVTEQRRPGVEMTTLRAVSTGEQAGFDRVVFTFDGTALPGYRVEYVGRPIRQCGSGNAVDVPGQGWLRVRFEPSRAHDDAGNATITDRNRAPGLSNLVALRLTCDFEGQVEWVLGLNSPEPYRVLELSNPARIVVDVRR